MGGREEPAGCAASAIRLSGVFDPPGREGPAPTPTPESRAGGWSLAPERWGRRDRALLGIAAGAWGALTVLIAVRLAGRAVDDFFITYRYAQNLAGGQGFVFNPGIRVLCLNQPRLSMLLARPLHPRDPPIPLSVPPTN